jgi:predicted membrane-bound mannosyltransferase
LKRLTLFVLLIVGLLAVAALAQTTGVVIPIPGYDDALANLILAAFGIGLTYVVDVIKGWMGIKDKKAVLLVAAVAFLAALVALLFKNTLTIKNELTYGLAVLGLMTGWWKFTAKS